MQFEEIENLICTKCGSGLTPGKDEIICANCNRRFPFKNGISDFRRNDSYWCNVPREKMRSLIEDAVRLGDWEQASLKHIPDYMEHFTSCKRADFRFLLPFDKESVVLDAGAMWGGISLPMAKEVKTLYAVDQTLETIEFLNVRARQSGVGNIIALASGLDKLPFRDRMFDLIIMSGVLEWVAMEEEAVISRDYYKPREKYKTYKATPSEAQINVLKEIRRVMKDDGILYLSIENRYALPYFLGVPDEHVNIKYIPLMPRKIADIIGRLKLNSPYRTYTYSDSQLKGILKKAGFQDVRIMGCHPHYIEPEFICPSGRCGHYLNKYRKFLGRKYSLLSRLLPSGILSKSIPSLVAISGDGKRIDARNSRIISMIEKHPEIKMEKPLKEIALIKSRKGDNLPAFYEIYAEDKETPAYFCKVARDPRSALILEEEFRNIMSFRETTKDSFKNISPLLGFINNGDFKLLVYEYLDGSKSIPHKCGERGLEVEELKIAVDKGIGLLCEFQRSSFQGKLGIKQVIENIKSCQSKIGMVDSSAEKNISLLIGKLERFPDIEVPTSAVHGDFNLENILVCGGQQYLIDFEHYEKMGLPFFDFGNITISSLLMAFGNRIFKGDKYNGVSESLMKHWVSVYQKNSGISYDVLKLICPISALEQKAKAYPSHRNPNTYPMYPDEIFKKLIDPEQFTL